MCDEVKNTMKQMKNMKRSCESIRCYVITALGSGTYVKFNAIIDHVNDYIKSCTGIHQNKTWCQTIPAAHLKYTNTEATGDWDKVDPHEAKLVALTIQLSQL